MDLGLAQRACIVTGGSGGIGLTAARQLLAEGACVLLVGRSRDKLEAALAGLHADQRARSLVLDVTAPDAGDLAAAACLEQFGRLDVVVNNAGGMDVRGIEELTDAEWQAQWDLHVMAPMRLLRAAVPTMVQAGWGRVVNVSSSSGKRPGQRNVAYGVTKAAVLSLSRAYADAYAGRGVLVNAVTPGPISTDAWLGPGGLAEQTAAVQDSSRDEVLAAVAGSVPRGALGSPEEVAAVIVFLCSEAAANVAGAAWSVDGGAVPVII